ncbi:cobalamin B12-binding domain-containing protein [Polynucleobacter kasalickyi]|uniref:Methanogenic corrinoid protein MtbC1 n=1 Tax=Polynucleobacter kasalickyi TaxID=1938817 RepID=A0A1W1Z3E3_9BURK|nr:cobalamin B12-binding domain-containing protein [Polynucleobacter kasalickyi]SMC42478.1 Methanogenic corrinoid protein MtbC1 [Polynucleobacter kasalickyi]
MRQNPNTYFDSVENCLTGSEQFDKQDNPYISKSTDKQPVDILVKMLDEEIIPRLLVSHKANASLEELANPGQRSVTTIESDFLVGLVVNGSQETSLDFVKKLIEKQVSADSIYLDLIPQTARKLGELWENDICTFSDVTVGLWRLQHILYELSHHFQNQDNKPVGTLNALLIPAFNSQHTLGLFILVEFFRRAGWRVSGEPKLQPHELSRLVFTQWFDVIGISVGTQKEAESLNDLIDTLRSKSMNSNVSFMVGGPLFISNPEYFATVNAEIKSSDANDAIRQAEILISKQKLSTRN